MHSSLDIEALENILSSLKALPSANACLQSYPEIGSTLHQHLYRRNLDFDASVNKKLLECALEYSKAHNADEPQSTLGSTSKSKKWFINNLRSCFIPHQYRDQSMEQMVNVLGFSSFEFYKAILKESIMVILDSIESLVEKGIAVPESVFHTVWSILRLTQDGGSDKVLSNSSGNYAGSVLKFTFEYFNRFPSSLEDEIAKNLSQFLSHSLTIHELYDQWNQCLLYQTIIAYPELYYNWLRSCSGVLSIVQNLKVIKVLGSCHHLLLEKFDVILSSTLFPGWLVPLLNLRRSESEFSIQSIISQRDKIIGNTQLHSESNSLISVVWTLLMLSPSWTYRCIVEIAVQGDSTEVGKLLNYIVWLKFPVDQELRTCYANDILQVLHSWETENAPTIPASILSDPFAFSVILLNSSISTEKASKMTNYLLSECDMNVVEESMSVLLLDLGEYLTDQAVGERLNEIVKLFPS